MNLAGPPPAWPIYKYQPITTLTLSNLSKRKLWASPPSSFNDPFECRLQRTDSPRGLEQLRLDNPQLSHLKDEAFVSLAIAQFEQQFAKWGIVCFSQRADDIMEAMGGVDPIQNNMLRLLRLQCCDPVVMRLRIPAGSSATRTEGTFAAEIPAPSSARPQHRSSRRRTCSRGRSVHGASYT